MPEICAIILAAGESVRMGTNKLLLPYGDTPIIRRVVDQVILSGVGHVLVVLGAFRETMVEEVSKLPVEYCFNEDFKKGMLSSVQCGFRNMPGTSAAALIFLGDQPMIPSHVTRQIVRSYGRSEQGIIVPVYRGKRGHPVLISRKYAADIERLDPSEGLRALLVKFRDDVEELKTDESGILRDIDTKAEYRKEIKLK